jgi:hypothetical protein
MYKCLCGITQYSSFMWNFLSVTMYSSLRNYLVWNIHLFYILPKILCELLNRDKNGWLSYVRFLCYWNAIFGNIIWHWTNCECYFLHVLFMSEELCLLCSLAYLFCLYLSCFISKYDQCLVRIYYAGGNILLPLISLHAGLAMQCCMHILHHVTL